jgi:hypothetical protein
MNIIDELGVISKQIKELEATARKIKAELIARGVGTYDGEQFSANVTEFDQTRIVPDLVRKHADENFVSMVTVIDHKTMVTVNPVVANRVGL